MVSECVWHWGRRAGGTSSFSGRFRLGPACRWPEACGCLTGGFALWSPCLGPGGGSADSAERVSSLLSLASWLRQPSWGVWRPGWPACCFSSALLLRECIPAWRHQEAWPGVMNRPPSRGQQLCGSAFGGLVPCLTRGAPGACGRQTWGPSAREVGRRRSG